jgi:hypothetical protein
MQPVLQDIRAGLRKSELQVKYNTTFEETERFNQVGNLSLLSEVRIS